MRGAEGRPHPTPLVVAAALAGAEGLLVLVYAVLEAAHVHADRATMGVTSALFFGLLGAALAACAWLLLSGRAWARGPVVMAQLMGLGLAWSFFGGSTTWISVVLGVAGLVVLAGLLHPASVAALAGADGPADHEAS